MTFAAWFWLLSWSVCGVAVAILAGTIFHRGRANRREDARRLERGRYIALLKARAERPDGAPPRPADAVLTALGVDLLELVRGDEKARFVERLAQAGVAAQLHARLRRGNARERILAAAALTHFGDQATQAALSRALDDPNREVRLTAALSLAANGHAPAPEEVIRRLGIGEAETSLLIVMLLAEMAQTDPAPVRQLLRDPATAPATKAAAAEALAACDDFGSVPIIAGLATGSDPLAREVPRYLAALAALEHPAGGAAVLQCLDSPSPEVRAAAARAAGRIGIAAAADRLERMLDDPGWWVRFHAARALLRLGEAGEARLARAAGEAGEPAGATARLTLAEHESKR